MSAIELKPCPFCGGAAEIIHIDEGENAGGSCVCCTRCMASGNVEFERKENFIDNWNRRAEARQAPDFEAAQAIYLRGRTMSSDEHKALIDDSDETVEAVWQTPLPAGTVTDALLRDLEEISSAVFGDLGSDPDVYADHDRLSALSGKMRRAIATIEAAFAARPAAHDLYKTGDIDAPDVIKDRNGEVVLGLCRRCGRGEIELEQPCVSSRPAAEPVAVKGLTEYELQVLLGTSIHGCNMSPDRVFSLHMAWHRLFAEGLIDRADGLAVITKKGEALVGAALSTPAPGLVEALRRIIEAHDTNTGNEPSISVFERAIDEGRAALASGAETGGVK